MPDRSLTIATYALGASLCAISILYVFGPTFALDGGEAGLSKRRIVGLENTGNVCYSNSVLQALANLPELRKYLIREVHRRELDGKQTYKVHVEVERHARTKGWTREMQIQKQQGIVTAALKTMLDRLNERPIHRKTINSNAFLDAFETAFRTKISRQQQDAHEFLHLVLERLSDEYTAGITARETFKSRTLPTLDEADSEAAENGETKEGEESEESEDMEADIKEDPFPLEGIVESHIQCHTCRFEPRPKVSKFVTLTLSVPQTNHTSISDLLDSFHKTEIITEFKCDKCRLTHAKQVKERQLKRIQDPEVTNILRHELDQINSALLEDPERELPDANLPSLDKAPLSNISRYQHITVYPRVLSIHLSRSISTSGISTKNLAKVSFTESMMLGSLLNRSKYRLSCAVTHKGQHNSGHYETLRRQGTVMPFATPLSLGTQGIYSRRESPAPSGDASTQSSVKDSTITPSPQSGSPRLSSTIPSPSPPRSDSVRSSHSSRSSKSLADSVRRSVRLLAPTSAPRTDTPVKLVASSERPTSTGQPQTADRARLQKRYKKIAQRWWRISDDKVKEASTKEVLGLQKEVYILFYEVEVQPHS